MSKKLIAVSAGLLLLAAGLYATWPRGDEATAVSSAGADGMRTGLPSPVLQGPVAASAATVDAASRRPVITGATDEPGFGALQVLVTWEDGRPAAGVGVRAVGLEAARNERRIGVTGADGSCLLPHLRPAPWQVTVTHADSKRRIEVQAGAQQSCRFTAKCAATVRGRVVDEQQRPVAGADICISIAVDCEYAVGLSDRDGAFVLPLHLLVNVGARKAGCTPSLLQVVDPQRPPDDLVLALRGNGGSVEGTVRDAHGQPVAWARVLIGMQHMMPWSFSSPYERQQYVPGGVETSTDREGRFTMTGVEPGKHPVRAWSSGCGVAHGSIEVTAGVSTCNLTLVAGGVVEGTVRDADGKPVGNATVAPVIDQDNFVEVAARSGDDGRFRLVDLTPGQWDLQASSAAARTAATITVTTGVTAEWNPVLRRPTWIRGRVLDADDRPLAGVPVGMDGDVTTEWSTATDQDGAFVLQPKDEGTVNLRVGNPTLEHVRGVRPGVQDLVVRLTAADLPSAWLRGRVVDQGAVPIRAVVTLLLGGASQGSNLETAADGRFEFGPLSPGRYLVRVHTPAHGNRPLPQVVLAPQGERDFGDVVMQTPGSATVDVRDEQGRLAGRSFVVLYDADGGWVASMNTDQGRATFPVLQPGRHFVTCGGMPRAARGELEVQPAGRAHADVQLAQVGRADVVVRDPGKAADLLLTALAFSNGRFAGLFGNFRGDGKVRLWLPPGSYSVEIRVGDGRSVRCEVTIRSLDDHPELKVELPAK